MPASIEDLTNQQDATAAELQRIFSNYKKDSLSRKTGEYLDRKIKEINFLWAGFKADDAEIRKYYESESEHPYFVTSFFDTIRQKYEAIMSDIKERQKTRPTSSRPVETEVATTAKDSNPANKAGKSDPKPETFIVSAVTDPDSKVKSLIKKQKLIINMVQNSLSTLLNDENVHSKDFYMVKMKTIERHWQTAQELHSKIWEMIDIEDNVYNPEEYFVIEEEIQDAFIQVHERSAMETVRPITGQPENTPTNAFHRFLNLPKIEIPKFDGDYLKWRQFRDLYSELIHNQPIPQCQKMWYLKTTLQGEAEKLIGHFTIADANYDAAWTVLNDRYENSRLLVSALINKLISQPAAQNEAASSIKSIHDTTQECLLSLQNLNIDTNNWDPLVLHLLVKKLDRSTHALWEQSLTQPRSLPSLKDFLSFLETRFQSLEAFNPSSQKTASGGSSKALTTTTTDKSNWDCICCKGDHRLFKCAEFLQLTPLQRLQLVQKFKHCANCLRPGHKTEQCSSRTCLKCYKKHNTLLHLEQFAAGDSTSLVSSDPESSTTAPKSAVNSSQQAATSAIASSSCPKEIESVEDLSLQPSALMAQSGQQATTSTVLLSTVVLNVRDAWGALQECRALLDSGSHLNFATEHVIRKLGFQGNPDGMQFEGIGRKKQATSGRVNLEISSRINGFSIRMEAQVLQKIVSAQPGRRINASSLKIPRNVVLADPNFHLPGPIDLLIGVEIFYATLSVGQIKLGDELPLLQNTVFGWTASGKAPVEAYSPGQPFCGVCSEDETLNQSIEKFWQLEELDARSTQLTSAEQRCETHFLQTTKRDKDGRYVVSLPFQMEANRLGESKDIALQRFLSVERKLARDVNLKIQYVEFMREYLRLGHMQELHLRNLAKPYYFLPHHCVLKPESTTTKLRVVFDASAKTSTNMSLNDVLAKGPTIQNDVFTQLLRFRLPRFVFTADIEKMYRQVRVDPNDLMYQLIFWRDDPSQEIKCFQLTTVTYGTSCAPYLAVRCLHKLADDEHQNYPLGCAILRRNFYVDDVLTGSDQLSTTIEMQLQLRNVLSSAGFKLRKWCANHPRLLQEIPLADQEIQADIGDKDEEYIKTMGLKWLPKTDSFSIRSNWNESGRITKRTVASDIARLYDPLGILAPVITRAKLFLREIWNLRSDWDASLPQELHTSWLNFRDSLTALDDIKFPRHIFDHKTPRGMQLHIFADASEKAYGAAAYLRALSTENTIIVRLLCAKSRVAPAKQISLPRLELCAAKLAAELFTRIQNDLDDVKFETTLLWSDSTAVLGWINSQSSNYHTFVANRISAIQHRTNSNQWRHVMSHENPADVLSRGISPERLAMQNLWFYGPTFLHRSDAPWLDTSPVVEGCTLEKREHPKTVLSAALHIDTFIEEIEHSDSFHRLQRVLAYVLRFTNKLFESIKKRPGNSRQNSDTPDVFELEEALAIIVKDMQRQEFADELKQLQRYGHLAKSSPIATLNPFIDEHGLLRVGGRLESSLLNYNAKHPILLPYKNQLTKLLMKDLHKDNLHAGPQTLLSITRQKFWPIKGKVLARAVVQNCIQCTKAKPQLFTQLMGNLPADRVQPARPFLNSGVDFCGPVYIHYKIRGKRPYKAYIAVFCCFATKAVHLELVSDLSTEAFIGALRRFTARRGRCQKLYCDNATNFIGARNQLSELSQSVHSQQGKEDISNECNKRGIEFKFIPPRAPHFGGLWEAAVKSAKHLLQNLLASASLTYEEMETAVIEAESIMNSRPITPLSSDPTDLSALTPAHLLIGEPYTSAVDHYAQPLKVNLLTRWKLVSHIKNEFWRRWVNEYLNQLQHRSKWKEQCQNIKRGMMVIIKEDNLPPLKWPLARVLNIIKGNDGLVRVVDVQTANSTLRRPIHRLAPLPVEPDRNTFDMVEDEPEYQNPECTSDPQQDNASDDMSSQPSKKPRMSTLSAIMSVLLAILYIPVIHADKIEAIPFTTNPGIFFENLGSANIISTNWNLVIYYNLDTYWKEYNNLLNSYKLLDGLCSSTYDRTSCARINQQIQHVIDEIEDNNMALRSNRPRRQRRGALNIVGNIAYSLFGVLDSEYAAQMSKAIDDIHQREGHLSSLMRNQTSLLDATINIIKRDHEAIEQEFQQIEEYFNSTMKYVSYAKATTAHTQLTVQTLLMISNLQRTQNAILDVLVDAHHGRINLQLITPVQLERELSVIKGNLPASVKLPLRDADAMKFYKLITVEGRIHSDYAIFKLSLPLVTSEEFELLHLVPVPAKVNDSFTAIIPLVPFLLVNLHRDQYSPLTEEEFHRCVVIEAEKRICKQHNPIYKRGAAVAACELDMLNHRLPNSPCPMVKTGPAPHWIQLYGANSWIYALNETTTLNVVCDDQVTSITLKNSGILRFPGNCMINQKLLIMQGHQSIPTIKRTSFSPSINLSDVIKIQASDPTRYHSRQYRPSLEELDYIKQQVANIETQLPDNFVAHNVHHYALGYIILIVLIGLAWYVCWIRCVNPQPNPSHDDGVVSDVDSGIQNHSRSVSHIIRIHGNLDC